MRQNLKRAGNGGLRVDGREAPSLPSQDVLDEHAPGPPLYQPSPGAGRAALAGHGATRAIGRSQLTGR
ncbi:hypothetical protein GCM10011505_47670 [Tistrella bauzanensis]|uniref:Uncharacterized protein n=1 Tax=Tistrella bauzanensis TaxID=657419 RepID=A0ABQ1J6W9_9PROT|nr:hypothetical protein GCM10011505_47670 [Tistrella bauzanensis]